MLLQCVTWPSCCTMRQVLLFLMVVVWSSTCIDRAIKQVPYTWEGNTTSPSVCVFSTIIIKKALQVLTCVCVCVLILNLTDRMWWIGESESWEWLRLHIPWLPIHPLPFLLLPLVLLRESWLLRNHTCWGNCLTGDYNLGENFVTGKLTNVYQVAIRMVLQNRLPFVKTNVFPFM